MNPADLEGLDKAKEELKAKLRQSVLGQQAIVDSLSDKILNGSATIPTKRTAATASIMLRGPVGTGKTSIIKKIAKALSVQKPPQKPITATRHPLIFPIGIAPIPSSLTDRFKPLILSPLTADAVSKILDKMIEKHAGLPDSFKAEAKVIAQEVLQAGCYEEDRGARALGEIVNAIATVAGAPDMAAALAEKYPAYGQRLSVKSGEQLAETFQTGTAGATAPLKPLKIKSQNAKSGRVGFFALH